MDAHIKQLRANGKTPQYCRQVTSAQLGDIIELLLHQHLLSQSQKVDLIATISNILLLNRQLHASFTSQWSIKVLTYLDSFLAEVVPEIDPAVSPNFLALVIVYRLVFLILYDGLPVVKPYVDDTNQILTQGLRHLFKHYQTYKNEPYYENVTVEILKGLYTLNHKYADQLDASNRISTEECIEFFVTVVPLSCSSLEPSEVILVRYFINLILVVSTQLALDKSRILDHLKTYQQFLTIVVQLLATNLEDPDSEEVLSDITNLFIILNFITGECNRQNSHGDLDRLVVILKHNIIPTGSPAHLQSSAQLVEDSSIYQKAFNLIGKSQSSLTQRSIADQLSLSNVTNVILQCYYNLCFSENQTQLFLDLIGYGYAKDFMQTNNIAIPSDIELDSYIQPNPKYLGKPKDKPPILDFTDFNHSLSSILLNHTKGTSSEPEEMTKQEKEMEAEKLFGIFDKMEKSSVFEGFKNPVREWQQSGRFEDLDASDSDKD
ncbi:uncharacterized protein CANTADRAFT_23023 [Suhomyces tanzawaensis NRRL Y-17324]|uniref:Uncharacterized protein n=1 Tax=Suhomyces tanzawaensis NRRL Y-17324 TaxID=984487 RepID=A0A1E4SEG8_9ASCO|nr:uncharacterized protein CANTADRAFT_23023 [Suhomyces tanzawaensis NRRL Y-17324]ODV77905.1 hypothetical protein CANTADRAFT_23023 [Suhomyces tanzawaensis NRRL Y-17324]